MTPWCRMASFMCSETHTFQHMDLRRVLLFFIFFFFLFKLHHFSPNFPNLSKISTDSPINRAFCLFCLVMGTFPIICMSHLSYPKCLKASTFTVVFFFICLFGFCISTSWLLTIPLLNKNAYLLPEWLCLGGFLEIKEIKRPRWCC